YAQSKLANILFVGELARRLAGTGIIVNALHPGFVATNIFKGDDWASRLMQLWARMFAISPEEGAKTSIYLATSPEVECVTGQYFVNAKVAQPSKEARDEAMAGKLWEVSEELTGQPEAV
ncbi:MAG: SDR family oxidoreductase, partial [Singulisphaera sp.]|nr:SDR family oxidoreductase [Singulisphaera sp.]